MTQGAASSRLTVNKMGEVPYNRCPVHYYFYKNEKIKIENLWFSLLLLDFLCYCLPPTYLYTPIGHRTTLFALNQASPKGGSSLRIQILHKLCFFIPFYLYSQ